MLKNVANRRTMWIQWCIFTFFFAEICPGDCIADRIAQYCEAYYKTPKFCGPGKKCCVSKDIEHLPGEIIIPHSGNTNSTFSEQEKLDTSKLKNKNKSQNKKASSTTTPTPENVDEKPCKGECVAGLFALFCDDIDSDAFCPGEASCCVKTDSGDNNDVTHEQTTTLSPMRTKPTVRSTKVINHSIYAIKDPVL